MANNINPNLNLIFMKKLLAAVLFAFVLLASFACTEENVEPVKNGEGGTSRPTGF